MTPNGFPGINEISDHHESNSEAQAERAGFDSLSRDQQEALARYKASGERARRIRENGDSLTASLSSCAKLLAILIDNPRAAERMPQTFRDSLATAKALLSKIEGGAS